MLFVVMKDLGNPFQVSLNDLLTLDTNTIAPSAAELVSTHLQNGIVDFRVFFDGLGDEAFSHKPMEKDRTDVAWVEFGHG